MRFFLCLIWIYLGNEAKAQTYLGWSDLSEGISWEQSPPETVFPGFQKATFTSSMKALEGKPVLITGYLLILDGNQSVYLLSKNPMASCFFCGNGGPETVLDLQFVEKPSFEMDELISVQGILRLNQDNPNACYYKLEEADAISFR